MARLFTCRHEHVSGRRCGAPLAYYGACALHQRPCGDCLGMLRSFPLRDGRPVVGL